MMPRKINKRWINEFANRSAQIATDIANGRKGLIRFRSANYHLPRDYICCLRRSLGVFECRFPRSRSSAARELLNGRVDLNRRIGSARIRIWEG